MKKPKKISLLLSLKAGVSLCAIFLVAAGLVLSVVTIFDLYSKDFFRTRPLLLLILCFAASVAVGAILLFLFAKVHSKKIDEFRGIMREVANGNYSVKMPEPKKEDLFYSDLIADFNKLVDELRSTAILQSDFASNFSHEFKTPIVSIKGYAEILEKKPGLSPEEQKKYLRIIIDETDRLTQLASSTLLISKLDSRNSLDGLEEVSIDEQIEECVLLLDSALREIDLEIELSLRPHVLSGNAALLKEVWINLLSNAIKFSRKGGRIAVRAELLPEGYAVKFSDNGVGMDETTLAHIFDRYYQGESSHFHKGNGLGLPIAKRIVELTGGRIDVASRPGEGSEFTVLFPLNNG